MSNLEENNTYHIKRMYNQSLREDKERIYSFIVKPNEIKMVTDPKNISLRE